MSPSAAARTASPASAWSPCRHRCPSRSRNGARRSGPGSAPASPSSRCSIPTMTGFSTRAIRAASRTPEVEQRPTSVPIFQTATFTAEDAQQLGDVLTSGWSGYAYSRLSNPTTRALGDAYAELAGGETGYALASGMAAIHRALAAVLRGGDRVLAPTALYGSTRSPLGGYFRRFWGAGEDLDLPCPQPGQRAGPAPPRRRGC